MPISNNPTEALAQLSAQIAPQMLDAIDTMVVTYMAMRNSVTLDQARATIASDAKVRGSYERKMLRAIISLGGPAGFSLAKTHNKQASAAPAAPDFTPASPDFIVPGMSKPTPDAGHDHDNQDDQA